MKRKSLLGSIVALLVILLTFASCESQVENVTSAINKTATATSFEQNGHLTMKLAISDDTTTEATQEFDTTIKFDAKQGKLKNGKIAAITNWNVDLMDVTFKAEINSILDKSEENPSAEVYVKLPRLFNKLISEKDFEYIKFDTDEEDDEIKQLLKDQVLSNKKNTINDSFKKLIVELSKDESIKDSIKYLGSKPVTQNNHTVYARTYTLTITPDNVIALFDALLDDEANYKLLKKAVQANLGETDEATTLLNALDTIKSSKDDKLAKTETDSLGDTKIEYTFAISGGYVVYEKLIANLDVETINLEMELEKFNSKFENGRLIELPDFKNSISLSEITESETPSKILNLLEGDKEEEVIEEEPVVESVYDHETAIESLLALDIEIEGNARDYFYKGETNTFKYSVDSTEQTYTVTPEHFTDTMLQLKYSSANGDSTLIYETLNDSVALVASGAYTEKDMTDFEIANRNVLISGPLKVGTSWVNKVTGTKSYIEDTEVEVYVEAGTYKAISIVTFDPTNPNIFYVEYLVKDLGMVYKELSNAYSELAGYSYIELIEAK